MPPMRHRQVATDDGLRTQVWWFLQKKFTKDDSGTGLRMVAQGRGARISARYKGAWDSLAMFQ